MAVRGEHAGALAKSSSLISPVVERGGAQDQVEGVVFIKELFGETHLRSDPRIGCRRLSHLHHRRRRVDPSKLNRILAATGEQAQLVTRSTAHVEDPAWAGMGRKRDRCGAIDDLAMQLSKPPVLVAGGSFLERLDISPGGHVSSLSHPRLLFGSSAAFDPLPALSVLDHFERLPGATDTALRLASELPETPTNKRRCQAGAGEDNAAAQIRVKT